MTSRVDELRACVTSRLDRRNLLAAAALGHPAALATVAAQLTADGLERGGPTPSDLPGLIECVAAGDRERLRAIVATWPAPASVADSPWFAAAWALVLRHLEPAAARALAATTPMLRDEAAQLFGVGDPAPVSVRALAAAGSLPIDWLLRRLAHRPLLEERITADELAAIPSGWLRVLRGRYGVLADDTREVLRARLAVVEPAAWDAYEVALIIEAARARGFGLDELAAERLLLWTDRGAHSWRGFEAILTLLAAWTVA